MHTPERMLFFDHLHGSPPLPETVRAMDPWLGTVANPQAEHGLGRRAHMALEAARAEVADLLGADTPEIVFGSSGTEVNNLAVKGFLKSNRRRGNRLLLSAVEHMSVDRACRRMADAGYELTRIGVNPLGRVDPEQVAEAISDDTALVCLQLANPEVGVVQPVAEVAAIARAHGATLLVDAVAAAGRLPIDVSTLGADLLTLNAVNLGGPPGAAALYVRRGVRIQPEIDGGVQESGRRGGLENIPALVGFGHAARLAAAHLPARVRHLEILADRMREQLSSLPDVRLTGPQRNRLPGHVSLLVQGAEGESLLTLLDRAGVAASSGSYCGAQAMKASPVLTAMGLPPEEALAGIVFAFGPANTVAEVDEGVERLRQCIHQYQEALAGGRPEARNASP